MPVTHINQFLTRAEEIWNLYQQQGPGQLDAKLFAGMPECLAKIESTLADQPPALLQAFRDVCKLCERCVCRSEGLCFITGEAGLIPRRDLHDLMESSLRQLQEYRATL
ncbi:MAG: hypothetical protein Tsb009_21920 [Planctomycetaceae bacterium]